jgi:ankyrin repeat protein
MTQDDQLLNAVFAGDEARIRGLVRTGADVNARCDHGASVLFSACLAGHVEMVRLLLDLGADPNLESSEPGSGIDAEKPLVLVMQGQFLMDWDKFSPVYDLLVERGATCLDGTVPSAEINAVRFANYIAQQQRGVRPSRKSPWWMFWK